MPGETNLEALLAALEPALDPAEYVFATCPETAGRPWACPNAPGEPIGVFREAEGVTLILRREEAERLAIPCTYRCRRITLRVHSSLGAVGLLAHVTAALAARGISVNAVSGYYHDHLFVPVERAEEALVVLAGHGPSHGPALPGVRTGRRNRR
jgi:hypothetical protein